MNTFISIIRFEFENSPRPFGLFHLLFILVTMTISYFIIRHFNQRTTKQIDRFLLINGIILVVIEVFKQLLLIEASDGKYPWGAFPWQFCSTPMYFYLISFLFKKESIKKAIYSFIGCFGIIGGLSVILTGGLVNTTLLWENLHTMIWHAILVICGVYVLVNYTFYDTFQEIMGGILLLILVFLLADIGNIVGYHLGATDINLFLFSPYIGCDGYPITGLIFTSADAQNIIEHNIGWSHFIVMQITFITFFIFGGSIAFILRNFINRDEIKSEDILQILDEITYCDSCNPFRIFI